jgi:hypothetical protein
VVAVIGPDGPPVMVVSGAAAATVNVRVAGVASTLPAASLARTENVCSPSARFVYACGEVQAANAAVSRRHSNVEPASVLVKPKDAEVAFVVPTWAYYLGGALLILAAAYFGPLLAIAAVKARRRRRRARGSGDRSAAGAWSELVDRYAELGLTPPSPATRLQVADALNVQAASRSLVLPDGGLAPLAARVDAVVFDGSAVSPEHAAEVWAAVDASVEKSLDATGWLQRRLAAFRLAPRSNRVRRPVASV